MANNDDYSIDNIINEFSTAISNAKIQKSGNSYKLLSIWADRLVDVQKRINELREFNDLDNEYGSVLDDEGRNSNVSRDGDNDDFYRFRIRLKRLRRTSKGTLPFLYKLIAESLLCDPKDFSITDMYGTDDIANMIKIDNIPAEYIGNPHTTKALIEGLQAAVAEGIQIGSINFKYLLDEQLYVGVQPTIKESISFDIDNSITEHGSSTGQSYIGVYPAIKELASFNIDGTIKEKHSISNQGYIGVQTAIKEIASFDIGNSINERGASIGGQSYIGVQPAIKEIANFDIGNSINESYSTDITNYFAMHVLEPYVFSRSKVQHYYMDISDGIVNRSNISVTNYNGSHTIMGARIHI